MFKKENIIFLMFSVASISIGLFTTYLLSNYLNIEDFGRVQFLLTLIGIFTIFYLSGFDIVIIKYIYNKNDNIVFFILKSIMPLSLLLLLMCFAILYIIFNDSKDLVLYATIIVSIGMFDKTNSILNAKLKFKQLRYLELYTKLILLAIVLIVIGMNYNVGTYLVLFTVITIFVIVMRIIFNRRYLVEKNKAFLDYNLIIKEGLKTTLSSSYNIFANWIEKLILGFFSVELLAIFTIGQLFPKVIKDNIKVMLTPTLSTWASQGFDYYRSMINKYKLFLYAIGIIMYIILYFLVDIIIRNFFIKYEESILIAQLLSITLVFKFVELTKMSSMALSKHTNIFNKINNISNTLKIVLVIILIPLYGIYGAVASILIVESLRFLLVTKEFNKLENRKIGK